MLKAVSSRIGGGGLSYQGAWNALTNSPTLISSVGTNGYYYIVSVAGSTNLNGVTDWQVGDWAIFSGTVWQKIDNSDAVLSVNGQTGVVVLDAADIGAATTAQGVLADTALQTVATDGVTITGDGTLGDPLVATPPTETDTLQTVTDRGATTTIESTFSSGVVTPQVKAHSSAGLALKANNGTMALLTGAGGSANGTLYGGWNYDIGTARGVPYLGDSKTITTNNYFQYDSTASRLESFSGLGTEKVTNGTFTGNAAGWTVGSGWAYSSNTMLKNSNGTAALSQNINVVLGDINVVSFVISALTVGSVTVTLGGQTVATVSANGSYAYRVVPTNTAALSFTPTNTARFTLDTVSVKPLTGGSISTDSLGIGGANYAPSTTKMMVNFSQSNSQPGTTRAVQFNNAGSGTFLDFYFNGAHKSSIGTDSGGNINTYSTGGNYLAHYYNSGGTWSLYAYNYPGAFAHIGYLAGNSGVIAGATYSPTSTLQTTGGLALKVRRITASQTLDNTATHWLVDATTAAACSGTPTYTCSHWTNQTDCELRDSHGGCAWNAGSSCSAFDYEYGMSTCAGTSGCTVVTASCSSAVDESSCLSQNDSYGGSCSWTNNPQSCSGFGDESTCSSYMGCTWYPETTGDCSVFSGNQSSCEATSGCSWSDPDCSGTYVLTPAYCGGTYDSYSCSGDYNTGTCSGTYGAACQGTSSCAGIDDSSSCGGEAGCTWSSVLNAFLPSMDTYPDRTYWVYNDSSGGADVVLIPQSGQTVNGTSSLTLAAYKDGVHVAPFVHTQSCSIYVTAGTCTPTGCSPQYANCSWNGFDNICSGNAICDSITDQSNCESTTYFSYCGGTEIISKDWKVWSRT